MFEETLNILIRGSQEDVSESKESKQKIFFSTDSHFPKKVEKYSVIFEGNSGADYIIPRELRANLAIKYVTV